MTETIGAGLKALRAPTGPPGCSPLLLLLILGSVGPSDSCPVFIALLCSSPTARPFAHTSHHNVSFFLVPGPVRVMGPLHGHLEGSFFTRDVLPEAHLPIPLISAPRSWYYTTPWIPSTLIRIVRLLEVLSWILTLNICFNFCYLRNFATGLNAMRICVCVCVCLCVCIASILMKTKNATDFLFFILYLIDSSIFWVRE